MSQQRFADRATAKRRPHIQIFEIQPAASEKGGKIVEKQRKTRRLAVDARDHGLRAGTAAEQRIPQGRSGRHHLILQLLVHRQLVDEGQYQR